MHYEREVFETQFPIARQFVYHLAYYKELSAAYKVHGLPSEFWARTIDAHLLQAAILWCNVLGAKGSSPIHWKRLSKLDSTKLRAGFRKGLPQWTGLRLIQWEEYWKELTDFRNKYAAHRDNYKKPVPNFDMALSVIYYYDNWVRNVISPHILDEPPLKATFGRLKSDIAPLIKRLFETTKAVNRHWQPATALDATQLLIRGQTS